jgi:NAD dependent epimerase/dehydratase
MTQSRKILVTGADGFIGSHLVEALLAGGCEVRAFVCYNSFGSWGWLDGLSREMLKNLDVFPGDIRDPNGVREAVRDCGTIFHLAALIAIPYSYHSPDAYIDTNIKGPLNVLQAARQFDVGRILVTSTSEVYGTAQYVPMDEKHPYQGQSPYSASKIGADRLAESFYRSFSTPVIIVRPFNTYGPRQSARAFIPTVITQLLSGNEALAMGNLAPTRDLNFVKDTVSGFIALSECDAAIGQEFNISSKSEHSIGEITQKLISLINHRAKIVVDEKRLRPDTSEVFRLLGDNAKIRKMTAWQPRCSLDEGLKQTVDWFRIPENLSRYKSWLYNI